MRFAEQKTLAAFQALDADQEVLRFEVAINPANYRIVVTVRNDRRDIKLTKYKLKTYY